MIMFAGTAFEAGLVPGSLNCGNAVQNVTGAVFMPGGATTVYTADLEVCD